MKYFTYSCGCKFPIVSENPLRIKFDPDIEKIPLDCERTWKLMQEGNTCGLFQLESNSGHTFCKKLKPESIEHLAALVAILRPSCLEAMIGKKSITQHYIDRKNKEEEVEYAHIALEPILKETFALMIYQESAMKIATDIAGFDPNKTYKELLKAIGKKKPEIMSKLKNEFLEGCKSKGLIDDDIAQQLWSELEKGQRYGFNKSITLDTKVKTINQNEKTIDELQVGEQIQCPNGYTTVLNKFEHGEQEVFEVKLESGKKIACTLHHKFLCEDKQIRPLWKILEENHQILCFGGV